MLTWAWYFFAAGAALFLIMTVIEKGREAKARKAAKRKE